MRIHTSLTESEIREALRKAGARGVYFHKLTAHGSRTHARSFEVRLEGNGGRNNTGLYGAGDYEGATWDEWGAFFGALFDADPDARAGGSAARPIYANRAHYHFVTGDRFHGRVIIDCECTCERSETLAPHDPGCPVPEGRRTYLPADTHPRHRWIYDGTWGDHGTAGHHCAKCSATQPSNAAANAFRDDQMRTLQTA